MRAEPVSALDSTGLTENTERIVPGLENEYLLFDTALDTFSIK